MRQEILKDRAVLIFSGDKVERRDDHSHPGLAIGCGKDRRIVRLEFLDPRRRSGTDQVLIVERYDREADALDVELDEGAWRDTEESPLGFLIDFDSDHRIVALEFLGASELFPEAALARLNRAA
jgi:uncharacterized protein YuzE